MTQAFELSLEILKCSKATKLSCHFKIMDYEKEIHQNMRIYIPDIQTEYYPSEFLLPGTVNK